MAVNFIATDCLEFVKPRYNRRSPVLPQRMWRQMQSPRLVAASWEDISHHFHCLSVLSVHALGKSSEVLARPSLPAGPPLFDFRSCSPWIRNCQVLENPSRPPLQFRTKITTCTGQVTESILVCRNSHVPINGHVSRHWTIHGPIKRHTYKGICNR